VAFLGVVVSAGGMIEGWVTWVSVRRWWWRFLWGGRGCEGWEGWGKGWGEDI